MFSAIETLLAARYGLSSQALEPTRIHAAVRRRMARHGLTAPGDYLERITSEPSEAQALVDAVVVAETRFFRDGVPFQVLACHAAHWQLAPPAPLLRVLCLPCASGEEAYSIAIELLAAGLAPESFQIDAMDVSEALLKHARRGHYTADACRTIDPGRRDTYFRPAGRDLRVMPWLQDRITFRQANLLDPTLDLADAAYDVVFFRNLLIYLDPSAKEMALARIRAALRPGGLLFLGHAEPGPQVWAYFSAHADPAAFACRKADVPAATTYAARSEVMVATPERAGRRAGIERMMRVGQFDEAAAAGLAWLGELGPADDEEAYVVLGRVRERQGRREEAFYLYRKAVYLKPARADVLARLAGLCEQLGDRAGARLFSERARRVERARCTA